MHVEVPPSGALGAKARKIPRFAFGKAVSNPKQFAATAIAIEELGVAAYNGQAANLSNRRWRQRRASSRSMPRHYVTRSAGFLRSCFVVVADEPGGNVKRLGTSKSFWRVGNAARRERAAEDAWTDFVNDLRATGWEPYTSQPSDFYVLLRPTDTEPSTIVPTIEAYTRPDSER